YTIRGVQRILKEEGMTHLIAIGRGEAEADKPAVAANEPKSVAVAPRMPKLGVEAPEAPSLRKEPRIGAAPEGGGLSAEQDRLLREALGDLAAARKLLGLV
ncbi:MAG: hypothetical protein NWR47_08100, partial [Aestuariivirgaceae bacterium]|nr:hypothetical protein [Aestuariivirgaceae bacterium]